MTSNATQLLFLSHASGDAQIARTQYERFDRFGLPSRLAPRDSIPGAYYEDLIVPAITLSAAFILIFSSTSNQSFPVRRALSLAVQNHIPAIPYRIEEITLSRSTAVYLASRQWFDAESSALDMLFPQFAQVLRKLLPNTLSSSPPPASAAKHKKVKFMGYAFLRDVRNASDFVQKLRVVFNRASMVTWTTLSGIGPITALSTESLRKESPETLPL